MRSLLLGAALAGSIIAAEAKAARGKVKHVDHVLRRALEKRINATVSQAEHASTAPHDHHHHCGNTEGSVKELRRQTREVVVSEQLYPRQGRRAAAAKAKAAKATHMGKPATQKGERTRQLQDTVGTSTAGAPYSYSNTGDQLQFQTLESGWGPLRVVWDTSQLFPTADNPTPDGDRSCYSVGQWARVGDPDGDAATHSPACQNSGGATGLIEDCWLECTAEYILNSDHYTVIESLLALGANEISDLFQVEQVIGPIVLNSQTSCGNYPPAESVDNADLLLFVHARPAEEGSGTTAYASKCQIDQHGRPISGHVGINPTLGGGDAVLSGSVDGVATVVHEIMHALGFTSGTFSTDENRMVDENLNPRGDQWIREYPYEAYRQENPPSGQTYKSDYVTSPRALLAARRFFNCPSLDRIAVEDEGGSGSAGALLDNNVIYP